MSRVSLLMLKLAALLVPALLLTSSVSAVNVFPLCNSKTDKTAASTTVCQQETEQTNAGNNPVITALKVTINILSLIVGISAVIGMILSGLNIITANGDAQKVAKARASLLYCLIGVAIVILAETIVVFVLSKV